jgi:F-type H+-transporting ATPase subunit delta
VSGSALGNVVSSRYATALFELAREKGALDAVGADVDALARHLESGAAREVFDRRTAADRRQALVEALASKLQHPLTSNLVRLLAARRRLDVLHGLPASFRRCALADKGQVEGWVESARPLGGGELAEIAVAVGSLLKKQVLLQSRVNPELLAGVRVFVDNRLIDQSAVGRLESLRRKLSVARLR